MTTQLSVSTRYLVLLPQTDHIGISQLIEDLPERARLHKVLTKVLADEQMSDAGGFILRTAAEGIGPDEIATDLRYLKRLWTAVSRRAKAAAKPALLYEDLPLHLRIVRDPARTQIAGVSELGLVQMTRKRTRHSLERVLCEGCPVCQGRGVVKTAETVCYEIFRAIMRDQRANENDTLMVLAAPRVVDRLRDQESEHLADLEEIIGKTISLRAEASYSQEHFDIILLQT